MDKWGAFNKVVSNESAIHRILLTGGVGLGKTTSAQKASKDKGYYSLTLHQDSTIADIYGMYMPKGNEFVFTPMAGIKAFKEGKTLILNEIDKASDSVFTICLALLDEKETAELHMPNGEVIKPHKDYKVIATMNGVVSDLPLALKDRFDIVLEIEKPHPDAIKSLPKDLQKIAIKAYDSSLHKEVTFRMIKAFGKLRDILGEGEALTLVFGDFSKDVKAILRLGDRVEGGA